MGAECPLLAKRRSARCDPSAECKGDVDRPPNGKARQCCADFEVARSRQADRLAKARLIETILDSHAAAAPPSAASNSRRPMLTVIRPSRARCVKGRIARHDGAVFTFRGQDATSVFGFGFHCTTPAAQLLANAAIAASRVGS